MTKSFESSKMFRTGRLVSEIGSGEFENEGKVLPFLSFQVESNIFIGFGQFSKEVADVLVVGKPSVDFVKEIGPEKEDEIVLNYATSYFNQKSGRLAIRVTTPEQITVIPKKVADAMKSPKETTDFVYAAEYFAEYMKQKNSK